MRRLVRGEQVQRLAVADLTNGGVGTFRSLLEGGRAEIVYSDPPWNPGNEKYWRRYAGVTAPRAYADLLSAWCDCVVACHPDHVFVEQSINESHQCQLTEHIERCPGWELPLIERWQVLYGSPKRPNALLHYGRTRLTTDPTGMSGVAMTRTVFAGLDMAPPAIVADPCMGLGTTSRVAHEFGFSCIGTELNAARLERTIARMLKLGYV